MNLQTTMLYGSAAATIGLLIAFARSNQKSGWKKSRTTIADTFHAFYADLGLLPGVPVEAVAYSPEQVPDFSAQLIKLRGALGASMPVAAPTSAPVRASEQLQPQLVHVRPR